MAQQNLDQQILDKAGTVTSDYLDITQAMIDDWVCQAHREVVNR